ncbi:MAG TPA: hypothetical protein VFD92_24595 [Candidatus Binatia bacterium]|nr:hypothetical protein [Candidatus Binatia bacterium]
MNSKINAKIGFAPLAVGLFLAACATSALAGAPPAEVREDALPHVCKAGPTPGAACTANSTTCDPGTCVVDFERGKTWTGVFTLIVDDTASAFDPNNRTRTAITGTLTLEVKYKGVADVISKTFLNMDGATLGDVLNSLSTVGPQLADSPVSVHEDQVVNFVNNSQMMSQFLFQSGDSTMAQALRNLLQTTGNPVITKVLKLQLFDHSPGSLLEPNAATVIRAKVRGAVVNP